mmetsp:Transcript_907/g.2193  ORF Transcript_907/g.2193 Transcript_907/m.2193 type:complete len:270 (-) Transcript_907:175-984(-)
MGVCGNMAGPWSFGQISPQQEHAPAQNETCSKSSFAHTLISQVAAQLDVTELARDDLDAAALMAARAFADSPPFRFACAGHSDATREGFLRFLFSANFAAGLREPGTCHAVYVTDGARQELACFFMLLPLGGASPMAILCELFRSGIVGSTLRYGLSPTMALIRFTAWAEEVEQDILKGRAVLRLEAMTVLSSLQGQGIGSHALRTALEKVDAQGQEVLLTTQQERNVTFYQRLGFDVVREAVYEPAGFRSWFMLRTPARSVGSSVLLV